MSQTDALKKYLDAGMAFTHVTRAKAEQVVKDLVAAGGLQRDQAKEAIDELLERSRKNAETLAEQVRKEVDTQLASLGLARKADVERLEEELAGMKGSGAKPSGAGSADDKDKADANDAGADAKEAGDGAGTGSSMPAKKSSKPAKEAPAKKASGSGQAGISGELPSKKAGGEAKGGDAKEGGEAKKKAAPAKKAAAADEAGIGGELPAKKAGGEAKKAAPAKKTAKKQG